MIPLRTEACRLGFHAQCLQVMLISDYDGCLSLEYFLKIRKLLLSRPDLERNITSFTCRRIGSWYYGLDCMKRVQNNMSRSLKNVYKNWSFSSISISKIAYKSWQQQVPNLFWALRVLPSSHRTNSTVLVLVLFDWYDVIFWIKKIKQHTRLFQVILPHWNLQEGCFPIAGRYEHGGWRLSHNGLEQLLHASLHTLPELSFVPLRAV